MTKQLLILRHGKSDWSTDTDDYHRPLKTRGKLAAQKVGIWLIQNDLLPDYIISSPAKRAHDTAEKCRKVAGLYRLSTHHDERIYQADTEDLLDVLSEIPSSTQRVLLVGHNPGLENLLHSLVSDIAIPQDGKLLPTGALALLQVNSDWSQLDNKSVRLVSITNPESLPDKFPFPAPGGTEYRDRPAYYYTQSAVIPYRLRNKVPEILIISSSSGKHWTVPKGIREPKLTAQESAAREACEEAGIKGQVENELLGQYQYAKWGSSCTVDVYPMLVTQVMDEDDWEESHRSRKWVSVDQAVQLLKLKKMAKMVIELQKRLADRDTGEAQ